MPALVFPQLSTIQSDFSKPLVQGFVACVLARFEMDNVTAVVGFGACWFVADVFHEGDERCNIHVGSFALTILIL